MQGFLQVKSDIKAVIVTNVPAPYRVPVWRRVAQSAGINLELVFCAPAHIDTTTTPDSYGFTKHFLHGRYHAMRRRFMHYDLGVWSLLNRLQPDVVITTGYIPTFLFAFLWTQRHGVPHIAMTDGTWPSEQVLTVWHRLIRKLVIGRSAAFVGASLGSQTLFEHYGVNRQLIHLAYLCADNSRFGHLPASSTADFIFCGRFIPHKQPLFILDVAQATALRLGRKVIVDFVGSGELEAELRARAQELSASVECRFHGYVSQDELPARYADAKIFVFPTEWDPWGVVANEACASGLPVIVSPYAGVAHELIVNDRNGYILELEVEAWTDAAVKLLSDATLYQRFSENSRQQVAEYNFDNSANGLIQAIKQAFWRHKGLPVPDTE